jgi:HAE1 family hydrophobic/amphiphilic exporter-1
VFIPAAFIAGITGSLYRQFALTIAFSVLISAFNALTLSPALGALILRPRSKDARRGLLGRFFGAFDRAFTAAQTGYVRVCGLLIR